MSQARFMTIQALWRTTLDLFGSPVPAAPAAAPRRARPRQPRPAQPVWEQASLWEQAPLPVTPSDENMPKTGENTVAPTIKNRANGQPGAAPPSLPQEPQEPPQPLSQALAPLQFRHPQANRQAWLACAQVAYLLRRTRRRTIGLTVGAQGLVVSVPGWASLREVEAVLHEKAAWIVRKLGEAQQRQRRADTARIDWRDGATLAYLGQNVTLRLDPAHCFGGAGAALVRADDSSALHLHVALPDAASAAQIRDAVQAWLMRQARELFTQRLQHFAPRLGVTWTRLRLSSANTRWGTAHTDGTIGLNWRLIHLPLSMVDYVVAHELSHLRVMDHSRRFWETLENVMPDYAARRKHLRAQTVPPL